MSLHAQHRPARANPVQGSSGAWNRRSPSNDPLALPAEAGHAVVGEAIELAMTKQRLRKGMVRIGTNDPGLILGRRPECAPPRQSDRGNDKPAEGKHPPQPPAA